PPSSRGDFCFPALTAARRCTITHLSPDDDIRETSRGSRFRSSRAMNAPPSSRFPLLVLASRNRKKSEEIAQLMSVHGLVLKSVADFPDVPDVVEDGDSFAANAAKK